MNGDRISPAFLRALVRAWPGGMAERDAGRLSERADVAEWLADIAGPGGTATVAGTWLDALDVDRWERRQLDAAAHYGAASTGGRSGGSALME